MKEPQWIETEWVRLLHDELVSRFGGLGGMRDEGLLESALSRPRQKYHYGNSSLYDLAAAYALGLIKNHPFLDGNKRIGFMVAYTFLRMNGIKLCPTEEEVVLHTLALAAGEEGETEYAEWLKKN